MTSFFRMKTMKWEVFICYIYNHLNIFFLVFYYYHYEYLKGYITLYTRDISNFRGERKISENWIPKYTELVTVNLQTFFGSTVIIVLLSSGKRTGNHQVNSTSNCIDYNGWLWYIYVSYSIYGAQFYIIDLLCQF